MSLKRNKVCVRIVSNAIVKIYQNYMKISYLIIAIEKIIYRNKYYLIYCKYE